MTAILKNPYIIVAGERINLPVKMPELPKAPERVHPILKGLSEYEWRRHSGGWMFPAKHRPFID